MDSAGTAWHAVKYGNLEMIMRLFPSQCNVYSKGPVGENVFHVAMLLNTPSTLAIVKFLVKLYGRTLVNTPYQERKHEHDSPGPYEGETAIHIAVVNHDFDMVKFLIQNGADTRARAYGSFFQPGSPVYFGEYPMSFAACTGQKDIVSYLKRHGALVNEDQDARGNTALHMCVHHDQIQMYDHLVEFCGADEHIRNNRSQTPLLLAAYLGKMAMFQHIYNKRRQVAWRYGPVTSYTLSLHEVDTVQDSAEPAEFVPSTVETLVRQGHIDGLADPLVATLLDHKWARFGAAMYAAQFATYVAFLIVQTLLVWMHSHGVSETYDVPAAPRSSTFSLSIFKSTNIGPIAEGTEPTLPVPETAVVTPHPPQTSPFSNQLPPISSDPHPHPHPHPMTSNPGQGSTDASSSSLTGSAHEQASVNDGASGENPTTNNGPGSSSSQPLAPLNSTPAPHSNPHPHQQPACEAAAARPPTQHPQRSVSEAGAAHPHLDGAEPPPTVPTPSLTPTSQASHPPSTPSSSLFQTHSQPDGHRPPTPNHHHHAMYQSPSGNRPPSMISLVRVPPASPELRIHLSGPIPHPHPHPHSHSQLDLHPHPHQYQQQQQQQHQQQHPPAWHPSPGSLWGPSGVGPRAHGRPGGMHGQSSMTHAMTHGTFPDGAGSMGRTRSDIVSVGLGYGPNLMTQHPTNGPSGGLHGESPRRRGVPSTSGPGPGSHAGGLLALHHEEGADGWAGISGDTGHRLRSSVTGELLTGSLRRAASHNNPSARSSHDVVAPVLREGGADGTPPPPPASNVAPAATGDAGGEGGHELEETAAFMGWSAFYIAFLRPAQAYLMRQLRDPITLVMACHLFLTITHFITWEVMHAADGTGPGSADVSTFDDIIVSLMILTGWVSLWYFARGSQAAGLVAVILEACIVDVLKFIVIYLVLNIGFTLAFYTLHNGATATAASTTLSPEGTASTDAFKNIGYAMMQLLCFMFGAADYDSYADAQSTGHLAFTTILFILYVAVVILLLMNVLIAMIVHTYSATLSSAEKLWRLRWASYLLRLEARLPLSVQQRFRLGVVSYDASLQSCVYSHQYEVIQDGKEHGHSQQKPPVHGLGTPMTKTAMNRSS
ncbi:MAG: hypothetical protein WDW38_002835 [Sanguina aurantia]